MRLYHRLFVVGITALPFIFSAGFANATSLYLKGNVVYRERMALPDNAEVEVTLADVSIADAPMTVISTTKFKSKQSSPIPFELKFDSDAINPITHRYALLAKITDGKTLLFTTTTNESVFSGEANDTQVFVQLIKNKPETVNKEQLVGNWDIQDFDGKKPTGQSPLTVQISDEGHVGVYGGCNRLGSHITIKEKQLSFGAIMSTKMACDEVLMKQENALSQALVRIQRFDLDKGKLTLLDAQSKPVLHLVRGK